MQKFMSAGQLDDAALDLLTPGWQVPSLHEATPNQLDPQMQQQNSVVSNASQHSLSALPSDLPSSAKPRYTLRSHQDQPPPGQSAQDEEAQKLVPPPKSLRIKGMQSNGFLIPMQPLSTAQPPVKSSSLSDKGASSEAPSLGEHSPRQSSGSGQPLSSSDLKRGPSNEGSLQEGRGGSLASQTSELVRVVTSGKPPEPRPGGEGQGKTAVAEGKRRRKTEGLPTSRVTRSAVKKQQEDLPRGAHGQAQGDDFFKTEQPQFCWEFEPRLSSVVDPGSGPAAAPSNFGEGSYQVILLNRQ